MTSQQEKDIEHLKNKHLIHKLSKYYEHQPHSNFETIVNSVVPHHHSHEAIIDTSKFQAPIFYSLSESEKRNRAAYALYKIRQLNPQFFSPEERETLDVRQPRFLRNFIYHGTLWVIAMNWGFHFSRRSFGVKQLGVAGALLAGRYAVLGASEWFYETVKMNGRRSLADKYCELYEAEELCAIVDPSYDVEKIKHMKNKMYYGDSAEDHGHGDHGEH